MTTITTAAAPDAASLTCEELLFATAERHEGWLGRGYGDELVPGRAIAAHLDAARAVLARDGWRPATATIWQALDSAARAGAGTKDSRLAAGYCIGAILMARTGALISDYTAWEAEPGRTATDIFELLELAADLAREYGPAASEAA